MLEIMSDISQLNYHSSPAKFVSSDLLLNLSIGCPLGHSWCARPSTLWRNCLFPVAINYQELVGCRSGSMPSCYIHVEILSCWACTDFMLAVPTAVSSYVQKMQCPLFIYHLWHFYPFICPDSLSLGKR